MKKLSSVRSSVLAVLAAFVRGWNTAAALRTEAQWWLRPI
jgi:hypothetical protein